MKSKKKISITIIIISAIVTFLQTVVVSISSIYENKIFQIISAVLSASVVALQSIAMNLKKIQSRRSSTSSDLPEDMETMSPERSSIEVENNIDENNVK